MPLDPQQVSEKVTTIILSSAEGTLDRDELKATGGSLASVGYSSLAYIRMLDMVENELGVYLDPELDSAQLETVDGIVSLVCEHLGLTVDA